MDISRTTGWKDYKWANEQKWYLSFNKAKKTMLLDVKISEEDPIKKYTTRINADVGDFIVVNGTYGEDYGEKVFYSLNCKTSLAVGNVEKVSGGTNRYACKTAFIFSREPDERKIACTAKNGIYEIDKNTIEHHSNAIYADMFCLDKEDFLYNYNVTDADIEIILAAISTISFPSLATKQDLDKAKEVLQNKKSIPDDVHANYEAMYCLGYDYGHCLTLTGYYPGWTESLCSCSVWNEISKVIKKVKIPTEKDFWMYSCFCFGRRKKDGNVIKDIINKNNEFKEIYNELVYRSALSILIRGGMTNLLETALSVDMPISSFYDKLIELACDVESKYCLNILLEKRSNFLNDLISNELKAKTDVVMSKQIKDNTRTLELLEKERKKEETVAKAAPAKKAALAKKAAPAKKAVSAMKRNNVEHEIMDDADDNFEEEYRKREEIKEKNREAFIKARDQFSPYNNPFDGKNRCDEKGERYIKVIWNQYSCSFVPEVINNKICFVDKPIESYSILSKVDDDIFEIDYDRVCKSVSQVDTGIYKFNLESFKEDLYSLWTYMVMNGFLKNKQYRRRHELEDDCERLWTSGEIDEALNVWQEYREFVSKETLTVKETLKPFLDSLEHFSNNGKFAVETALENAPRKKDGYLFPRRNTKIDSVLHRDYNFVLSSIDSFNYTIAIRKESKKSTN